MTSIPYNRGRPNKKFGHLKIESSTIENLRFNKLFTTIINNSDERNINIIDEESKDYIVGSGKSNIIIGVSSGTISQGDYAISIGTLTGTNVQNHNAIAIGYNSGNISQRQHSISIGTDSGYCNQMDYSISIGAYAGKISQKLKSIAIGYQAGHCNQKEYSISIGNNVGYCNQGCNSISIGAYCGGFEQKNYSIAIGYDSGYVNQDEYSIALGFNVGTQSLGKNSIVIGRNITCTQENTIVINPSETGITAATSGLYIGGINNTQQPGNDYYPLVFNPSTSQVIYDNSLNVNRITTILGDVMIGLPKKILPTEEEKLSVSKFYYFYYSPYAVSCMYEVITAPSLTIDFAYNTRIYGATDNNNVSYQDFVGKSVPKVSSVKIMQPDINNDHAYLIDSIIRPPNNTVSTDWHFDLVISEINTTLRRIKIQIIPKYDRNPAVLGDQIIRPYIIQTQFFT